MHGGPAQINLRRPFFVDRLSKNARTVLRDGPAEPWPPQPERKDGGTIPEARRVASCGADGIIVSG